MNVTRLSLATEEKSRSQRLSPCWRELEKPWERELTRGVEK